MSEQVLVERGDKGEKISAEQLYDTALASVVERRLAVDRAEQHYYATLEGMSDDEILSLVEEMGRHEAPMDGAGARVAVDMIVSRPVLAYILAQRRFGDCTSFHDQAVLVVNSYLHDIWNRRASVSDDNFRRVLAAAERHREGARRMAQAAVERASDWPDGCC